jgi:branched-chain amino acid transport system ATP-binding protein
VTPALHIKGLTKRFGGLTVTDDVDLTIAVGERRLLLGPNGAGKTTLFNIICGEIRADSGTIALFGSDIHAMPTYDRAQAGVARTYQILTLFPRHSFCDNVTLALLGTNTRRWHLFARRAWRDDFRGRTMDVLRRVGLQHCADKRPGHAAYGELRRLEIAMALAQEPKLLMLDEPLAGLSREERQEMQTVLTDIPRSVTVVLIEHDLDTALALTDFITVLHHGKVICEGKRNEITADPRVREIYLGG